MWKYILRRQQILHPNRTWISSVWDKNEIILEDEEDKKYTVKYNMHIILNNRN